MDEKIAGYLRDYCTGEVKAVTSQMLERAFDLRGVEIRKAVNRLRRKGVPVCSCAQGYYYAETEEELTHTIRQLFSRSREIAAAANGMLKALPDYREDGQVTLTQDGGDCL